jgi:hypothetical protein
MKKLALTTAIALALSTAAYAAGQHTMGSSPGGNMGSPGISAPSGGKGLGGPGFSGNTPAFSGNSMKGAPGGVYNQGNIKSFNQNGPYKSGGNKFYGNNEQFTKTGKGSLYNYGEHHEGMYRDHHEGMYREHHEGLESRDHHGVVRGNFFEHGRHFGFRRFWHGEWVFLNDWDDCTAYAWVHVAPRTWAWMPVDICVG